MTKKPHFYYKVKQNSEAEAQVKNFLQRCDDASEQARTWAEEHGASQYIESPEGMAGGLAGLFFKGEPADGFKPVPLPDGSTLYWPEEDSETEREMLALPVVSETELIGIFKLVPHEAKNGKKVPMTFGDTTPLLFFHPTKQCYYTDVPYKSASDELEEIDEKEFYRRWGAARNMA